MSDKILTETIVALRNAANALEKAMNDGAVPTTEVVNNLDVMDMAKSLANDEQALDVLHAKLLEITDFNAIFQREVSIDADDIEDLDTFVGNSVENHIENNIDVESLVRDNISADNFCADGVTEAMLRGLRNMDDSQRLLFVKLLMGG